MKLLTRALAIGALVLLCVGCAKKLRTLEEIEADKRDIPALYLTETTHKEVTAPAGLGLHIDSATGEICYQPFECTNPSCPGRSADGKPVLFVHRDVLVSAGPDGKFIYEQIPAGIAPEKYIESKGGHPFATCPKCLEKRQVEGESDAERKQYQAWVRPYVSPETEKRRAELEAEYQEAYQALQKKRRGES
jgi:hypothetical protein